LPPVHVLDSFALLAMLGGGPGAARVRELLAAAAEGGTELLLCWVNYGEVVYITERKTGPQSAEEVIAALDNLPIEVVGADRDLTLRAARIKARHALSYADAFAAALAQRTGGTLVTGDPEFAPLEGAVAIEWLART